MSEHDQTTPPSDDDRSSDQPVDETVDSDAASDRNDVDTRTLEPADNAIGQQIGPYRILEALGEGGMGSVYLAEQREPVKRRVALKIIKVGMDSGQVIARFEAERQALALMDHANIAKVFDAGTTESGRPYFVMELVNGVPITQFCDNTKLGIDDRLELFSMICNAVQHAHQKGIIHRDLKPTNVLVTIQDDQPIPKVIDFGLAKATNHRLTEQTMFTAHGQVLGTLEYMSPEQANQNDMDVDTRSDIYSLGVMLYELLTGSTPLRRESLRKAGFIEILKRIMEEEPERPSSRIGFSSDMLESTSSNRQINPRKFSSLMKGELDWIVMKAIAKDRNYRYETANNLATDVQRFLNKQVVHARPPSIGYLTRKFAQKHKLLIASVTAIVSSMVFAIIGVSWFALKAKSSGELAEESAKRSQDVLQIVTSSFESTDPDKGAPSDMKASLVLSNVQNRVDDSDLDDEGKAMLEACLTISFLGIGEYDKGVSAATKAYTIHRQLFGPEHFETLKSLNQLGKAYLLSGEVAKAVETNLRAFSLLRRQYGKTDLATLSSMNNLAHSYQAAGQLQKASNLFEECLRHSKSTHGIRSEETLSTMLSLALTHELAGRFEDALLLQREVLDIKESQNQRLTLKQQLNLGNLYLAAGQVDEAINSHRDVLAELETVYGVNHPNYLVAVNDLAAALLKGRRSNEAIELLSRHLPAMKKVLGEAHPMTIVAQGNLATAYASQGRITEATVLMDETIPRIDLKNTDNIRIWAFLSNAAYFYHTAGRSHDAMELFEKVISHQQQTLGDDHPDTLRTIHNLIDASMSSSNIDENVFHLAKQNLSKRAAALGSEHPETLSSMTQIASLQGRLGDLNSAIQMFKKSLALQKKVLGSDHKFTIATFLGLAGAYRESGNHEDAVVVYEEAFHVCHEYMGDDHIVTQAVSKLLAKARAEMKQERKTTQ